MWDQLGQVRYRNQAYITLKEVHGIILVFDYTSRKSFQNINIWLEEIKDNLNSDIIIVLFGNKIDIEKEKYKVTSEEAKEYSKKMNLMLFDISAKINQGINEGVSYIVNQAYSIAEKRIIENNNKILKEKNDQKTNENCVGKKIKNKKKSK